MELWQIMIICWCAHMDAEGQNRRLSAIKNDEDRSGGAKTGCRELLLSQLRQDSKKFNFFKQNC